MNDTLQHIELLKTRLAEAEAIAGIPPDIKAKLDAAQREFEAAGGCPGCGSKVLAVHEVHCPTCQDDLY